MIVSRLVRSALCCALVLISAFSLAGCGTTRVTDTSRTGTEMLLVSTAVDDVVSRMDFQVLSGKKVYFDPQYIEAKSDKEYVVSSIRQSLLAHGCLLQEKREDADYIVEARCGALGTDRHDLLFGVPQFQVPSVVPWQPGMSVPEIPVARKTEQVGVAKLAVYAFNCKTGRPVWQSGVVQHTASSKDVWLFGAGPFRSGSIRKSTEFAGEEIGVPFVGSDGQLEYSNVSTGISVVQPAIWHEPVNEEPKQIQLIEHQEKKTEK